jgi:prepilin-type N-terminal cleavage/methylation domain-containing protein
MDAYPNSRGFTFIEILLAVFIGLLLMASISITMISGQKLQRPLKEDGSWDVRGPWGHGLRISIASFNYVSESGGNSTQTPAVNATLGTETEFHYRGDGYRAAAAGMTTMKSSGISMFPASTTSLLQGR